MSSFPDRLKRLREEEEFTQEKLGSLLNVSDATINRYEKGLRNPDPNTLDKLAGIFNVSVDYLLGRTDIREPARPEVLAAHRIDDIFDRDDIPPEAKKSVEDFIAFVKKQYKIKE